MKTTLSIIFLFLSATSVNAAAVSEKMSAKERTGPRLQHIELKPYTQLTVHIVPDMGTRFTFPFILDEGNTHVPFTLNITNPVFHHDRHDGRNHFVVTLPPPEQGGQTPAYQGNLFVSVAGYNLTILLKATNDQRKHVTDYVFKLSKEEREYTIQQQVARRIKRIKQDYAQKEAVLNKKARAIAFKHIGELALLPPQTSNIKEETNIVFDNGDKAILYLDKVYHYGTFSLFVYEIENNSTTESLKIHDVALLTLDEQGLETPINSINQLNNVQGNNIAPGKTQRGVLTTHDTHIPGHDLLAEDRLRLWINTNRGEFSLTW